MVSLCITLHGVLLFWEGAQRKNTDLRMIKCLLGLRFEPHAINFRIVGYREVIAKRVSWPAGYPRSRLTPNGLSATLFLGNRPLCL